MDAQEYREAMAYLKEITRLIVLLQDCADFTEEQHQALSEARHAVFSVRQSLPSNVVQSQCQMESERGASLLDNL